MTEPSKAVFLSYASQDTEAARRICETLQAGGIEVWFDQSELRGGDAWDRRIRSQIQDCALFVPIISIHSQARLEGYFRREWKLAADRTHDMAEERTFLVPVVIDDTSERSASVPDKFREVQWTRLPAGKTPPAFVERVSRVLSATESHNSGTAHSSADALPGNDRMPKVPTVKSGQSWRSRPALLLIVAAVILAGGCLTANKLWLSKRIAGDGQKTDSRGPSSLDSHSTIPEKSIAVLPFVDLSEKKDQEYFADGMAEEIINLLVKIPELKVIGRTSSFQFNGKTDDLRKIGTVLGATYVVEGSVRRSGNRVRVTAQLVDTRDGVHRWSEAYDRSITDVLQIQDEIATNLARELDIEVAASSAYFSRGRSPPRNSETYDSYLRGMHALNRFDQPGMEQALAEFQRSLELDPSFAPAAEMLTATFDTLSEWGFIPPRTGFEQMRTAANAALKLNPNSAIAHAFLSTVHVCYDWDWPAAAHEIDTALILGPNNPLVLFKAGQERLAIGRWKEALHFITAADASDPLSPVVQVMYGWVYMRLGRLAEAESAFRRALAISPTYVSAHFYLGLVLLQEGKAEAALAEMQQETLAGGQLGGLAVVYYALHRAKDADAVLERLEAESAGDQAFNIAEAYAYRGQKDKSFLWLERAYAQKDIELFYVKGDPLLKNLESDPRYDVFLRKMNLLN